MEEIIKEGDRRWERLYSAWKADRRDAGWLVIGSEQYRVIARDDDAVIFIPVVGNIDSMYGTMTGGIPK